MNCVEYYARPLDTKWNEKSVTYGVFIDTMECGPRLVVEVSERIVPNAKELATQIAAVPELIAVTQRLWDFLKASGRECDCGFAADPLAHLKDDTLVCIGCETRVALMKAGVTP